MINSKCIERYTDADAEEWNSFVARSKNGTFLFDRSYMDYHRDRFTDHSLIIRNNKGHIVALIPANENDGILYSHQGLTYGGLIMSTKSTLSEVNSIFCALMVYLKDNGFSKMIYKPIPRTYHTYPSDEDLYALTNVCHATIIKRMASSVVVIPDRIPLRQNRRTALNKAYTENISVSISNDIDAFWTILEDNLRSVHNSTPVHTASEMKSLMKANNGHITLLMGYKDNTPMGGIVLYITPSVVHTQYISATLEGKRLGVVDALIDYIFHHFPQHNLDIGTSAGDNGELLNEGLMFQKEGFGARSICYDTYEIDINHE